jgi:hypothetical protein
MNVRGTDSQDNHLHGGGLGRLRRSRGGCTAGGTVPLRRGALCHSQRPCGHLRKTKQHQPGEVGRNRFYMLVPVRAQVPQGWAPCLVMQSLCNLPLSQCAMFKTRNCALGAPAALGVQHTSRYCTVLEFCYSALACFLFPLFLFLSLPFLFPF